MHIESSGFGLDMTIELRSVARGKRSERRGHAPRRKEASFAERPDLYMTEGLTAHETRCDISVRPPKRMKFSLQIILASFCKMWKMQIAG